MFTGRLVVSRTLRRRKLRAPRLVSAALIQLHVVVPLVAATALDARSPASQRRQYQVPIRPPVHVAGVVKSVPAKKATAPVRHAQSHK